MSHISPMPLPSESATLSTKTASTLAAAVEQILQDLRARAATLDAELIIELALEAARAKPGPLPAVIGHLVENSLDAVARAARGPWDETPHQILVTLEKQGDHIVLGVTDTGIGLDPHILDKQGNLIIGRSTKPGGAGLGLRLVREIVERSGGELAITEVPNAGVHAQITIPLSQDHNAAQAA